MIHFGLSSLRCFVAAAVLSSLLSGTALAGNQAPRIGMLYWVGGNQLNRANTDGSEYTVLMGELDEPDGLTLDLHNDLVFWTNMSFGGPGGSLQRLRLDGSPVTGGDRHLVEPGSFQVGKEIERDPVESKLYWADRDGKYIMRANDDGSRMEPVLHKFTDENGRIVPLENPVGIALDLDRRQVYITDRFMGTVMRFNMDMPPGENHENRSDVEVLVEPRSDGDRPIDVDLDLENRLMYWTDRGVHQVLRANLDGSDLKILVGQRQVAIEDPIGMSLDLLQEKMYWSDMTTHQIHRANLDGSQVETIIGGEKILNGVPYGPLGVAYKALDPEQGPATGGNTVAVLGAHFVSGRTTVRLGDSGEIPAGVLHGNLLTFDAPPGKPGVVSLTVNTPHGSSVQDQAYRYR